MTWRCSSMSFLDMDIQSTKHDISRLEFLDVSSSNNHSFFRDVNQGVCIKDMEPCLDNTPLN